MLYKSSSEPKREDRVGDVELTHLGIDDVTLNECIAKAHRPPMRFCPNDEEITRLF